jgi:hypothetical protein
MKKQHSHLLHKAAAACGLGPLLPYIRDSLLVALGYIIRRNRVYTESKKILLKQKFIMTSSSKVRVLCLR